MKIRELIQKLQEFDPETEVIVEAAWGQTPSKLCIVTKEFATIEREGEAPVPIHPNDIIESDKVVKVVVLYAE